MPLDPSIFQNAGPKPMDIGSLIEMARGKQRLDAESSMGDIFAGAAGPDGSIDTGKLATATNLRRAGPYAANLAQQSQALQQGQNVIDGKKMENARDFMKLLDAKIFPLLSEPDETLHGKIQEAIHDLVGHENSALKGGMFTAQMGIEQGAKFYGKTPYQQRTMIGQMHAGVIDGLKASEIVANGVYPATNPDGSPNPNAGLPVGVTASGAIVHNAQMTAHHTPGPPGGAYLPPGRRPPPATPQSNVPPGAMPMQAPLGTGQSTEQMMAGNAREANYTQEITPWNEALRDVQKLKAQGFSFGPGAKGRQEFQSFLYSLSPQLAAKYGVDPEKLRLFADASKYLTQATNARAAAGLHGSDMQLGAMISGNPNVDINSMSIEDTVKMAIMLRRLQYAQHYVAKNAGPTGYANAASNFPTEHDQRAFGTDLMTEAEHKKLMKSLKKGTPEYERFNRSLKAAHDSRVMPAP